MQLHILSRLIANTQQIIYDFILPDALVAHQKQMFAQNEVLRNSMELLKLSGVLEEQRAWKRETKS